MAQASRFKHPLRMTVVLLMALSVCAVALAPVSSAKVRVRTERFKVTLSGSQTNVWREYRRDPFEICGITASGSGREAVSFSTARPVTLTAKKITGVRLPPGIRNMPLLSVGGSPLGTIRTRGKITRTGTLDLSPNSPLPCADGDGDGAEPAPVAPDCGTKTFKGFALSLLYVAKEDREYPLAAEGDVEYVGPGKREDLLALLEGMGSAQNPWQLFKRCPVVGPNALQKVETSRLPERVLMGRQRAFKVRGERLVGHSLAGTTYTVGTRWTMTFTRLRTRG